MSEWQLIGTAPKDGTQILVHCPYWVQTVKVAFYSVSERFINGKLKHRNEGWDTGSIFYEAPSTLKHFPTHWMPLPEPPPKKGETADESI